MHHCASELGWIGQANISILEQRESGIFCFSGLCWHLFVKVFEPRELRVFTRHGLLGCFAFEAESLAPENLASLMIVTDRPTTPALSIHSGMRS
jgi:hypothetical protein